MSDTTQQIGEIPDDRPFSEDEARLVRWMLEHGKPEARPFLSQLDLARVVSRCRCGCASVNFAVAGKVPASSLGLNVLADFLFGDETNLCGAFVFEKGGLLAGLEVYGLAVDAPKELPDVKSLRPAMYHALP